ncbi:E3 ubiquitin-protein ligase MARCHF3-like [Rhipicephalus sanguineus]|uniref:E3 ubiquitin-protein ligase MARCHF3-like n=1 Tax=Rhipicephalus sanguineus TaxID=34632 RepID=UPI0020C33CE8|nr:E3 ubiquitin-protein ligase MARCHF3-like [Rhipicephalus sanguineus]
MVSIIADSPAESSHSHLRKSSSQRSVQTRKTCSSLTDHLVCRYCFKDDHPEEMVAPCRCLKRSTVRWTHVRCLDKYMNRVHSNRCNICKKRMAAIIRQKDLLRWNENLVGRARRLQV